VSAVIRPFRWSFAIVAAATAACTLPAPRVPAAPGITVPNRLAVRAGGRVVTIPLEEYVLGSVLAEVTPVGESADVVARIYEVQAVVARTYAAAHVGRHHADEFDLCDTTHCQLYDPARIRSSRFSAAAAAAVRRTAGQVLRYGPRTVDALYHADCGGATASAEAVWGGRSLPYLHGATDDVPATSHRKWTFSTTADAIRKALNQDPRTAVGARFTAIDVLVRDDSGRAASLALRGERYRVVRGEDLRAALNRSLGEQALPSTRFSVTRAGPSYRFDGSGFGHGVGLCQAGAAARARRGDTLAAILRAYFGSAALARR
jgi:stage II sporulation protein D